MMVVMQELGRGIVIEPYFATVLGAEFLKKPAATTACWNRWQAAK